MSVLLWWISPHALTTPSSTECGSHGRGKWPGLTKQALPLLLPGGLTSNFKASPELKQVGLVIGCLR